jgi:hypothetical protein
MGVLPNIKHEIFAQAVATSPKTGLSQGECYTSAGFKTNGRSADACAARLLTDANVRSRIAELVAPAARRTRAKVDTLASQFDAVFDGAMGSAQFGAAGSAAAAKAKLLGFMRDKIELGSPGTFSSLATPQEVVDQMILESRDPHALVGVLESMLQMARERLSNMAVPVSTSTAPKVKPPTSEAEKSLELLRPGKR